MSLLIDQMLCMQGAAAHLETVQDHLLEQALRALLAAACRAGRLAAADSALAAARARGAPRTADTWVHVLRLRVRACCLDQTVERSSESVLSGSLASTHSLFFDTSLHSQSSLCLSWKPPHSPTSTPRRRHPPSAVQC